MEIKISCQGNTTVDINELLDLQGNLKDLSEDNYHKLRDSIIKFGFSFPVFMWVDPEGRKFTVDSHQRQRVLKKMRDEEGYIIPPLPADLIHADNLIQAKEKLLLLNSQYGRMTQEGFDEFVSDIPMDDISDLLALDNVMFEGQESETVEDEAPEVNENEPAVSQLGQVYQLGRHRLMCGDSTKIEDVEKLMNGQKADMVFTDPPYAIYGSSTGIGSKVADDNMIKSFFRDIMLMTQKYSQDFSHIYICCDWRSYPTWTKVNAESIQLSPKNLIVWLKERGSGIGTMYGNVYEFLYFLSNKPNQEKITRKETGERTVSGSNVWEIHRATDKEHTAQKPIELMAKAITNSTDENKTVLDLFGGSGSTLIACEQTNRTCYMMEIDPKYCDVIRKRYHKFVSGSEDGWQDATPVI